MKITKRKRLRLIQALHLAIDSEKALIDAYWIRREPNNRDYIMEGSVGLVRRTEASIKAFEKLLKELENE